MKILIKGYGSIGQRHFNNLRLLGFPHPDVHDPAKGLEVESFSGYDLVIVCTPAENHLDDLHFFNNIGTPYIMLEKPLCVLPTPFQLPSQPHSLLKSQVFVNHAYRFERGILKLKELCENGVVGEIGGVFMENWYDFRKMHPNWDKNNWEGVIHDDSHIVNISRYLWGEPIDICFKYIDSLNATFGWKTDRGIEVHHTTIETSTRYKKRIEVVGEKGNLIWNFKAHEIFFADAEENERVAIPYKHADHLMESLKYVLDVVEGKGKFVINNIEDAIRDMEVIGCLIK